MHWNSNTYVGSIGRGSIPRSALQYTCTPKGINIRINRSRNVSSSRTTTTSARACSGVRMSSSSAAFGKRLAAVTPRVLNKVPRVRYGPKSKARAPKAPRCRTVSTVAKSAVRAHDDSVWYNRIRVGRQPSCAFILPCFIRRSGHPRTPFCSGWLRWRWHQESPTVQRDCWP